MNVDVSPLIPPVWPPRDEETARRLAELYLTGEWSFNGPYEQRFAREFAGYHGAKYGVFMANGTVTLQCALAALGVGPGDEVIIPALTWPATAMAAIYLGATPVFVDIEPGTLCLDPSAFEAAITEKTRAVIPVHLYGGMADIERILTIARQHDVKVIEDCAHAHGGIWNGRGVGSWGDIGSFSFQQSKTVSSGEGGICLTNDEELAERLYRAKHIGYGRDTAEGGAQDGPPADLVCHNFRGTEFQALILQSQLQNLKNVMTTYNRNAAYLEGRLADVPGVRVQSRGRLADTQSYYGFTFIFDEGPLDKVALQTIQTAVGAIGLPALQTYGSVYNHLLWNIAPDKYRKHGDCPVADIIGAKRTLMFHHWWLGADEETIECIADIIIHVAENPED